MSNNITVDRDALSELIGYAHGEIDTRTSCLKDAGPDRAELEAEISEGLETIAAFEALLSDRQKTPHLRRPYYQAMDALTGLQNVLNDSSLCDDGELFERITRVSEALEALRRYMDKKYIWD